MYWRAEGRRGLPQGRADPARSNSGTTVIPAVTPRVVYAWKLSRTFHGGSEPVDRRQPAGSPPLAHRTRSRHHLPTSARLVAQLPEGTDIRDPDDPVPFLPGMAGLVNDAQDLEDLLFGRKDLDADFR